MLLTKADGDGTAANGFGEALLCCFSLFQVYVLWLFWETMLL